MRIAPMKIQKPNNMNRTKNPAAVALGRLGGKAGTGDSKRRKVTSEQARAAVQARWKKRKLK